MCKYSEIQPDKSKTYCRQLQHTTEARIQLWEQEHHADSYLYV